MTADSDLSDDHSRLIASAIREELARRRISRQTLADLAKLSLSTLEKALAGRRPFTLATTIRLEEALGTRLRRPDPAAPMPSSVPAGQAPDHLGSYARASAAWLVGSYLTLRPSFGEPGAIFAYRTEIQLSDAASCLIFREAERLDQSFNQQGWVSLSNQSGHIYLVTSKAGQYRLAILGRPTMTGEMYGILTTLRAGRGTQLTPISVALALVPIDPRDEAPAPFGRIPPGHATYGALRRHLDRVTEDGFAQFRAGPEP